MRKVTIGSTCLGLLFLGIHELGCHIEGMPAEDLAAPRATAVADAIPAVSRECWLSTTALVAACGATIADCIIEKGDMTLCGHLGDACKKAAKA